LNLLYLGKEKEGFELLNQAKTICQIPRKDGTEKYLLAAIGLYLPNYYIEKSDYKNALIEAKIGEEALRSMKMPTFDYLLNKIFYQAYKNLGKPEEALSYFEKVQAFDLEIQTKESLGQYLEWQLKYEDEKQKNKIQNLENQQLTQTKNILLLAGLLALSIIGYVFWNNRKLKNKNEEIQSALLQGQTMERKRMASELHDNISNKILSVKMRVEMLENEHFTEKEKSNYEATLGFIDEVYSDVRLVSHNLLPDELETKGLEIAIENLVKKINLIGKTHFENSIKTLQSRFSPRLEYEIYNVILELVNNILKHAEAKNALISINKENNLLKISVKDNGKGFDNQLINFDSLGLKSIYSRIEALRGKVDILNNNGTEVLIEVPVS
jgi:signal transduction histidine kinase